MPPGKKLDNKIIAQIAGMLIAFSIFGLIGIKFRTFGDNSIWIGNNLSWTAVIVLGVLMGLVFTIWAVCKKGKEDSGKK